MTYTFEIVEVINGDTPEKEKVWLKASADFNTAGYALVDRTFNKGGHVSNEFRHICVFPEIKLKRGNEWLFTRVRVQVNLKNTTMWTKNITLYIGDQTIAYGTTTAETLLL